MVANSSLPKLLFKENISFYRAPTPLPPESPLRQLSPTPDWDKRYPFIALLDGTIPQFKADHTENSAQSIMWSPEENQKSPSLLYPSSGEDESDNTPLVCTLPVTLSSVSASSEAAKSTTKLPLTSEGAHPSPKNIEQKKQEAVEKPHQATVKPLQSTLISDAKKTKHPTTSSHHISGEDSDNTPLGTIFKSTSKKPQLVKAPNPSQTLLIPRKPRQEEESSARKPTFFQRRGSEHSHKTTKVRTLADQQVTAQPLHHKNYSYSNPHPRAKQSSQQGDRKRAKHPASASSIMKKNVILGKKPKAYDRPKPVARQAQANWARGAASVIKKSSHHQLQANNKDYNRKNIGLPKRTPRIRPSQLGISKSQGVMHQSAKRKAPKNWKSASGGGSNLTSQGQASLEQGFCDGPSDSSSPVLSTPQVTKTSKKRNRRPSSLPTSQPRKRLQMSKPKHFSQNSRKCNTSERNLYKPGVESMNFRRKPKQRLPSLVEICQRVIKVNREAVLLTRPIKLQLSKRTIKTILNSFGLRHHEILCKIAEMNPRWSKVMEPLWEKVCDTTYPQFKSKKPEGMTFFNFYKKWVRHRKRIKMKAANALKGQKAENAGTRKVNVLTMQETKKMFPKKKRRRKC
jgi:hypothetical protein